MNWYYAQGDQRQGPVTEAEFEALIAAGTVNEKTLVWKEGMDNWAPLKEVRPLAGGAGASADHPDWIRCTATGRYFPPEEIVYLDGKPYSAEAKASVLQGLLQTGTLQGAPSERTEPAWEKRAELGAIKAIWETMRQVLLDPTETFGKMKREGGLNTPLGFHVMLGWVGGIASIVYGIFIRNALRSFQPPGTPRFPPESWGPWYDIGMALIWPFLLILSTFIMSGLIHLTLSLFSGAKQPFETTLRVYCYSMGAVAPLQLIPICGAIVGAVWAIVCLCIGVARAHEMETGHGVGAVLIPFGVCCTTYVVFYGFLGYYFVQNMPH